MATRGSQGGLPRCISNVTKLLDAFGKDIIIVETIGVGQTEISITEVADTIVLVLSPESGDSIQFMKAGLIEIADVIVVSKYPPSKLGGIAGKGWDEATPPCDSSPQQAVGYSRWNFIKF